MIATGLLAAFAALIWYSVTLLPHRDLNPDVTIHTPSEHASSLRVVASDQYAVWEFGTGDIFGYDLRNNKEVPVSLGEPYSQEWADISGVTVVYESRNDETYELPFSIVAKNLETGSILKFPTGTSAYVYPKIYGPWWDCIRKVDSTRTIRLRSTKHKPFNTADNGAAE